MGAYSRVATYSRGRFLDIPVSRMDAYSRGRLFEGHLIEALRYYIFGISDNTFSVTKSSSCLNHTYCFLVSCL